MALLNKSLALVSVGITCQAAFQMKHNQGLIEEIAGESFEAHATPFDWLLCDAPGVTGMIRDRTFYPRDLSELKVNGGKPYWPRYGVHFWHQKYGGAKDRGGEKWLGRSQHCVENWNRIGQSARRVFILSNAAKANAERALADREMTKTTLELGDLRALLDALKQQFGEIELHVITADDLCGGPIGGDLGPAPYSGLTIHNCKAGSPTNWKGGVPFWHRFFRRICG